MPVFQNEKLNSAFESHISAIDNIISANSNVAEKEDVDRLEKLKENFILKIEDFFRVDRKLNIGVIGQVKAGKSSFLNSLLFGGKTILPKASTPKTATLTKIEYSPVNKIAIEYYSVDDWEELEDNAKVDKEEEIYTSARELVKMAAMSGIDVNEKLQQGKEIIEFDSYEELVGRLNDYVGENGRYTALIKSVTLYLDKEELKEISIVDTPGLNDPISSRTTRTKEFIEVCDVVFFLSQSTSFLDKSDWVLLSTQLPQKGVKQLVLIVSKYDSAFRDILRHKATGDDIFDTPVNNENETDSIDEAEKMLISKFNKRVTEQLIKYEEDLKKREQSAELIKVISNCNNPIPISAMAFNMSNKPVDLYDKEEMNVYNAISEFSDNIQDDLKMIANFEAVQDEFSTSVSSKEALLTQKSSSFIPTSLEEIRALLTDSKEREEKRLVILENSDLGEVAAQKKETESQINSIKSDVVNVMGEVSVKLESRKIEVIQDLRKTGSEYSQLSEKTGTRTVVKSFTVSTSKWYNPFSWGSSRTEYYDYQESYNYLDASDAVANIHRYSNEVISELESVFTDTVNTKVMKKRLLDIIVNNFDTSKGNYDAAFFKLLTEKTLNEIEFPVIKLDFTDKQNQIASKFSGEITSGCERTSLNQMLSQAISKIFDEVAGMVEVEIKSFKLMLNAISDKLLSELLKNIQGEFDEICRQFEDKEAQIERIKSYIGSLSEQLKKL